tara:strand:- start:3009 stop:3542 length:534 start_codon:yes stop_codon:yes gene_type:complete
MESSYKENNLDKVIYDLVTQLRPKKVVEVGTLEGYSAVAIGTALKDLGAGHLDVYDLFEEYQYKHSTLSNVQKNIDDHGLQDYVTLHQGSLEDWLGKEEDFDLLHVDISNDGNTVRTVLKAVEESLKNGATCIFEGGSEDRDEIDWMIRYNHPPINPVVKEYKGRLLTHLFPSICMF